MKGDMSTPDRLNERPIYLRSVFLMLALCQTAIHVYSDYSSVHIPVSAPAKTPEPDSRTHKLPPISMRVQNAIPRITQRCAAVCVLVALFGPFIYALFLRQTFWSWHLRFAKLIYSLPRSDARPTGYPPSKPKFMLRSFGVGFLLMLTWETTSFFFSTFLAQEPLKKDQPLSTGSKDPNGTLITGLKATRNLVKTFAFWELVLLAQKNPERRKVIFADIGREGGPAWTQMLSAALNVVQGINSRIEAATTKPRPKDEAPNPDTMEIDSLPCIAPPIKERPIFASSPPPQTRTEEIESYIDWGAKRIGQSKNPYEPPISKWKGLLKYVTPAGIPPENLNLRALFRWFSSLLQNSPIGWFFLTTFARKVNTTILGCPHSNAAVIIDAIEATTRMLVASLSEDTYGKVISGVPTTVRTFTATVNAIESFVQDHVKEEAGPDEDIEEVEIVLARLKTGLAELLSAFQLYLTDQGLSAVEHRAAQNACAKGRLLPEREERRKEQNRQVAEMEKARQRERERELEAEAEAQQKGDDGRRNDHKKDGGAEKGKDRAAKKDKDKAKQNAERRPQKRLEPQDPARKKLFQNTVPKSMGRNREMEMVR
ncbi:hypothetical protein EPUS_04557 [Endocarpon pusillum Z07020]|uniref:Nuclear envelope protein n=1 Tax=Endocarpon pusillum (strain Z07020 / HMAS-L-300199) TaxID=1263415 RepID=U1GDA3_ENDPU|nr:uncharacterized protein EPUS_04557 [Endocarpon pusillum Z07020]ERF75577.1 hypothetical protein EPUS_04557 [Endocarpon pusillum Z07020]